ncbi:hypothetical protein AZE42_07943 [Rhizopogon vesiculosus]|uniref:Uncharacterized protein n=1 Tax=Rhizopogon vesiculosus TaxID=180088 RepID=A0A1J8REG6_9AGAM|nr:hypothetical protein AZE42_07943 [Rhizopogon vesiculosus]
MAFEQEAEHFGAIGDGSCCDPWLEGGQISWSGARLRKTSEQAEAGDHGSDTWDIKSQIEEELGFFIVFDAINPYYLQATIPKSKQSVPSVNDDVCSSAADYAYGGDNGGEPGWP